MELAAHTHTVSESRRWEYQQLKPYCSFLYYLWFAYNMCAFLYSQRECWQQPSHYPQSSSMTTTLGHSLSAFAEWQIYFSLVQVLLHKQRWQKSYWGSKLIPPGRRQPAAHCQAQRGLAEEQSRPSGHLTARLGGGFHMTASASQADGAWPSLAFLYAISVSCARC